MNMIPAFSLPRLAAACGMALALTGQAQAQGTEAWREFARRSMMPDYAWNDSAPAHEAIPSLYRMAQPQGRAALTVALSQRMHERLSLSVGRSGNAASSFDEERVLDFQSRLSPLQQDFMGARFTHETAAGATFAVSALVVRQQFATPGFGLGDQWHVFDSLPQAGMPQEVAYGRGLRMDYRLPLGQGVSWGLKAQSRLEMDALESVHGIHAESGDFDLPARLGTQLEWQATAQLGFALEWERVLYSQIKPFTSSALPPRLLSLMADGAAPEFAWRDQSVWSLEARLNDTRQGLWWLRYSTRQQPHPSEALYRQALASEYSRSNFVLGYQRDLGPRAGQLRLMLSHAGSMAFLGAGPVFASQTYARGALTEFEASWHLAF